MAGGMDKFIEAVVSIWDNAEALQAVTTGGLHLSLAQQSTVLPYITFNLVTSTPDYIMGDSLIEDSRVQFSIFASNVESAMEIYEELRNAYDDVDIDYVDALTLCVRRESETGPILDIDDNWQITIDYMFMREV